MDHLVYHGNGINDNDHHRKRSERSRSRSRDRHDRKHRKRRRRSRSHSGKRDSWNSGTLGPSASALLSENERLEQEVYRLNAELACVTTRIKPLENELRKVAFNKANADKQVTQLQAEKQTLEFDVDRLIKKEQAHNTNARGLSVDLSKAKDDLIKKDRAMEFERRGLHEQQDFLSKRNETLARKCEELLEKNRYFEKQSEDAYRSIASIRSDMENMQAGFDMKMIEFRRMENELSAAREKERTWKLEKSDIEKKLQTQVAIISRSEIQKKRDKERIDLLEKKMKSTNPMLDSHLGLESVYRFLETLKHETALQFRQLNDVANPAWEKAKIHAFSTMNEGPVRPIRIMSAPPLPSLEVSSAAQSQSDTGFTLNDQSYTTGTDVERQRRIMSPNFDETLLDIDTGFTAETISADEEAQLLNG